MSRRLLSSDTDADRAIMACIVASPPIPFVVRAGAGSGKTTSLIKALTCVLQVHGATLSSKKRQVACITYTDLAAREVSQDIEASPQVHVSTIHSFYWTIIKSFQADIKSWVISNIQERLLKLAEDEARFTNRTRPQTRENNKRDVRRYTSQRDAMSKVVTFTYGMGSDYPKGVLGHDDVIKIANFLLIARPLFRRLVGQKFPFIFIDESQDTMVEVVECFKRIEIDMRGQFCVGFFGDPMQKIYLTGVGNVEPESGWRVIDKPENYRCAGRILALANSIRSKGDGLEQVRGAMKMVDGNLEPIAGTARLFLLSSSMDRKDALGQVRDWTAKANGDDYWRGELAEDVKVLVIVHRMAAKRLGFGGIYAALNDGASAGLKQGFQQGNAWPLRPFLAFVLPLVTAMKEGDEFLAMNLLREFSPRLRAGVQSGGNVAGTLRDVRSSVLRLVELMDSGGSTTREVLEHIRLTGLFALDQRYERLLDLVVDEPPQSGGEAAAVEASAQAAPASGAEEDALAESASMDEVIQAFLGCAAAELWTYRSYVTSESPFATQHGVKGAEFDRVLVVMDEEESDFNLYNYEKFFGIAPLSANDDEKMLAGEDNVWARTMRLLYVCCTRAKRDLALVLFTSDPASARAKVETLGLLPPDCILGTDALGQ